MKEFRVNEFITLKLENKKTNIYIKNQLFRQCKFLLLSIPIDYLEAFEEIESIDEAADKLDNMLEKENSIFPSISAEEEYWAHCSNLQAWAENNYDSRILHYNIAFPLLRELVKIEDPIAKRVFKEQILECIRRSHDKSIEYLLIEGYREFIANDEFWIFIESDPKIMEELENLTNKQFNITTKRKRFWDMESLEYDPSLLLERNRAIGLNLKGQKLNSLPMAIGNLKHLEILNLNNNKLNRLPKSLYTLKFLKKLYLNNNKITKVSNSIENLENLSHLEMGTNPLKAIPENLYKLKQLKDLYCPNNNIITISPKIEMAKSLRKINLNGNKLTSIPKSIGNLNLLQELEIGSNQLETLPESMGDLELLEILNLENNRLKSIPSSIGRLPNLAILNLDNNKLKEIPESIFKIESLKSLSLKNNYLNKDKIKRKKKALNFNLII